MPAPKEVIELVERFERNLEEYKSGRYKESQLRSEFLNPFFEALGWDVNNKQGYAPAYREVIIEDSLSVGEWTKSPDYCFKVGKERKFFLEAKKPSVNISADISPAYQLRRYAWSAKLPLSILSDFEEFAVYDTRIKPVKTNGAKVARIMCFTYKDYIEKWDEIAGIFSREAVLKGSFDKYAETGKKKRGTAEVDDEFLKEIESWREVLAKNIADNNPKLSTRELNYAVQSTIDRIIFLRICEDRRIEDYARLMALQNGDNTYPRLCELFSKADDKYNSGLFHFSEEKGRTGSPDTLALKLKIDDKPLKEIIKGLYYPDSPYQFDYMPIEILGQVYEQFLGKVIRLEGHHAIIEEKPEVRKAGGVYYTPKYIVDYIVKNTVGKLLDGKTPKQATKLKILDPACGSGSFLIGAYQYLLDWHREWYEKDGAVEWAKKKTPVLYQDTQGGWQLTIAEKKRILLNNIFGVDIDSQAVEVTKLSLLLKVLEGETAQTINTTLRLFHERALPDLGNNIKCGNSLIGPDFYDNRQTSMLNEEEKYHINVFDWKTEFKEIMAGDGFDVVIGNPPWGAELLNEEMLYLTKRHPIVPTKTKDSYMYFVIQSLELLRASSLLGFIVPNTWLLINNAKEFRGHLLSYKINEITDNGDGVFKQATVESAILILSNKKEGKGEFRAVRLRKGKTIIDHLVGNKDFIEDEYFRIILDLDKTARHLLKKIRRESDLFADKCNITWGIKPYQVGYGVPPQSREMVEKRIYHSRVKKGDDWRPLLVGSDVNRYEVHFPGDQFIKYGKWLMYPSNKKAMLEPKILLRQTSDIVRACYDAASYFCQNSVFIVYSDKINLKYLLGILNSKLIGYIYKMYNPQTGKVFAEIKPSVIKQLPIYRADLSNSKDKDYHNRVIKLVDDILDLHTQLARADISHEKEALQRQIDATDKQIDQLVYQLYGLTEEEVGVVEGRRE